MLCDNALADWMGTRQELPASVDEEADDALFCASGELSDSEGSREAPTAAGQVSCTVCPSHICCVGLSLAGPLLSEYCEAAVAIACVSMILWFAYTSPTAMPSFVLICTACGH